MAFFVKPRTYLHHPAGHRYSNLPPADTHKDTRTRSAPFDGSLSTNGQSVNGQQQYSELDSIKMHSSVPKRPHIIKLLFRTYHTTGTEGSHHIACLIHHTEERIRAFNGSHLIPRAMLTVYQIS